MRPRAIASSRATADLRSESPTSEATPTKGGFEVQALARHTRKMPRAIDPGIDPMGKLSAQSEQTCMSQSAHPCASQRIKEPRPSIPCLSKAAAFPCSHLVSPLRAPSALKTKHPSPYFFTRLPNPGHKQGLERASAQSHGNQGPCDGRNLRSGHGRSAQR